MAYCYNAVFCSLQIFRIHFHLYHTSGLNCVTVITPVFTLAMLVGKEVRPDDVLMNLMRFLAVIISND